MQDCKLLIKEINNMARLINHEVVLMEVCGTHTQAVRKFGIREILPKNITLVTGPGCPVCVTAQRDIDIVVNLALAGIPIASYGDVLRVPGNFGSLEQARQKGARVFPVYSVMDALESQKKYPDLVFFGLGFETTTPMTAWAIKEAAGVNKALREPCEALAGSRSAICDFSVFSSHKLFLPAMKALASAGEISIDGFINPGHVSTIIGIEPYKEIEAPQVITGFENNDVLLGIYMLLKQIKEGRSEVENAYPRSVRTEGNPEALKLIFEVFEPADGNWRGLGMIPGSGLKIRKKYEQFDAEKKYAEILSKIDFSKSKEPAGCKCGEILRGIKTPDKCPMFRKKCSPENPYGPCMVSVEGACNVEYNDN